MLPMFVAYLFSKKTYCRVLGRALLEKIEIQVGMQYKAIATGGTKISSTELAIHMMAIMSEQAQGMEQLEQLYSKEHMMTKASMYSQAKLWLALVA